MCPRPLDDGDVDLEQRIRRGIRYRLNSGGAKRDRTADLLHAMQALSQLSYGPDVAEERNDSGDFFF